MADIGLKRILLGKIDLVRKRDGEKTAKELCEVLLLEKDL